MDTTTTLRAQHVAAEAMIDQIFTGIDLYRVDGDADPLTVKLARLGGIMHGHFAMEDASLYPSMIESDQREAALTARVFRNEMVHIGVQFDHFLDRWSDGDVIARALRQFEYEAGMLFAALRDRIDREQRDLYPLAEQVTALRGLTAPFEGRRLTA